MDLFSPTEWQRLSRFQPELGLIGLGFFVLITVLGCLLYRVGRQLDLEKLTVHPYLRFAYVCLIKPHDKRRDAGQQTALENFYAAQVG